jgi:hypothetical protein
MKNLKVIAFITLFLVVLSATSLLAQRRSPSNTGGARAAYGYPVGEYNAKKKKAKKKKQRKFKKPKQPAAYRKKNPWAN